MLVFPLQDDALGNPMLYPEAKQLLLNYS